MEWLSALGDVITWIVGQILGITTNLLSSDTFRYLFVLGIGISLIMVTFKIIRKITWGA